MKSIFLLFISCIFAAASFAQSINDGKQFLYYERYKSAKDVFQKLSDANPSDETAAYYLGQAMIGLEDVAGAKTLYQQKLAANPNSPLLIAGMGQVALLEGNTTDARNRFDAAVSMAAGKRVDVLNAVGAPNSDPDSKNGDANYAVEKLKQATTIKGFKDPEVWVNLGDAYRKIGDGGSALTSYQSALGLDPNYVRATYRIGRLYQSQGQSQEALYMKFYNEVIAKDPKYAPVYNTLFNYYYETNVPKAADYLNLALNNSDDDPKACYQRASIKYAQGLFADALAKANDCISTGGTNVYPALYGVKALAAFKLGDSMTAKSSYEEYFTKQMPDKIQAGDYANYGMTLLKFPDSTAEAASYIEKAVAMDTLEVDKVTYLKALASAFREQKNFDKSAQYYSEVIAVRKNFTNLDLYNAGYDYFRAGKFDSSMNIFTQYTQKYPDDMFGYYMLAKASTGIDTTRTTGLSVNAYLKAIDVGEKTADSSKVRDYLTGAYDFMSQYSIEIKRDKPTAVMYDNKALAINPADPTAVALKDYLDKWDPNAKAPATRTTKPAGSKPKK